jgi:hypothetical protein
MTKKRTLLFYDTFDSQHRGRPPAVRLFENPRFGDRRLTNLHDFLPGANGDLDIEWVGLRIRANTEDDLEIVRGDLTAQLCVCDKPEFDFPAALIGGRGFVEDEAPEGAENPDDAEAPDPFTKEGRAVFIELKHPVSVPRRCPCYVTLRFSGDLWDALEAGVDFGFAVVVYLVGTHAH